jgi:ubiquinone/menaquinone biosynthesis C-methylase UbiE
MSNSVQPPDLEEMRLGKFEFMAMNNPVRRYIQEHIEFKTFNQFLEKRSIDLKGKIILDVGCGSGYSTELILKKYMPAKLIAFDLMPEQISLAKKRNIHADFFVGDATDIIINDQSCSAAFVFGIIHHIPTWQNAVDEISRVLESRGYLLIEEPEARFTSWRQLERGLNKADFVILEERKILLGRLKSYLCRKE